MTPKDTTRLKVLSDLWRLTYVLQIDETGIAHIHKMRREDGAFAVLKLYKNGNPKNEGNAGSLLAHWAGKGAARLFEHAPDALLLEWIKGPSLGDLVRDGKDRQANEALAKVAALLSQNANPAPLDLPPIQTWYKDLFDFDRLQLTNQDRVVLERAASIATGLFDTPGPPVVLHGDLHHDNILKGPRGWTAIDPKGIMGEAEAELANTFRNPKGAEDQIASADRLVEMAQIFSNMLGMDQSRLLHWAAAKTGLSAVWQLKAGQDARFNLDLLPIILGVLDHPLSEPRAAPT